MSAYTQVTGQQPDLQIMTIGDPVLELQRLLDKHCYGPEPAGYFGAQTERCLNEFKTAYGMTADGLVDQATWGVLNAAPRMVSQVHGAPHISGWVLYWTAENVGCPTIPANTIISQCNAYDRTDITNLSYAYDFGPATDLPIRTTEPFSIDLFTLFPNDGEYTAVITVGTSIATADYDIVNRQVVPR